MKYFSIENNIQRFVPPHLSIRSSASASVCAGGRPGAWSDCSGAGAGAASRGGAATWGRGLEQGRARGALWVGSCTSSADIFGVTLRYEDIMLCLSLSRLL